ncbi:MAG: hypothetical protein ACKVT2_05255 [Saprospiraceae bacterium]
MKHVNNSQPFTQVQCFKFGSWKETTLARSVVIIIDDVNAG